MNNHAYESDLSIARQNGKNSNDAINLQTAGSSTTQSSEPEREGNLLI